MKYLVAVTGATLTALAQKSVEAEQRASDAAAYNRADEFLSCSMQQAGLRWIKFDIPFLPSYIREFADAVYEFDTATGMRKTKSREAVLETEADARIVMQSVAQWYTRPLQR